MIAVKSHVVEVVHPKYVSSASGKVVIDDSAEACAIHRDGGPVKAVGLDVCESAVAYGKVYRVVSLDAISTGKNEAMPGSSAANSPASHPVEIDRTPNSHD